MKKLVIGMILGMLLAGGAELIAGTGIIPHVIGRMKIRTEASPGTIPQNVYLELRADGSVTWNKR